MNSGETERAGRARRTDYACAATAFAASDAGVFRFFVARRCDRGFAILVFPRIRPRGRKAGNIKALALNVGHI